jgi:hypothetical protein
MAIPAVLAIELRALLTTQHRHAYRVFDRPERGVFAEMMSLAGQKLS